MTDSECINFNVRGVYFSLLVSDIECFGDTYFAHLLKNEWNEDRSAVVNLDRDSSLFRLIQYYMYDPENFKMKFSLRKVLMIRREADFYNLSSLVAKCDAELPNHLVLSSITNSLEDLSHIHIVHEDVAAPVDPLLASVLPYFPPAVATASLEICPYDRLTTTGAQALRSSPSYFFPIMQDANFANCKVANVDINLIHGFALERVVDACRRWPLAHNNVYCGLSFNHTRNKFYVFETGGHRKISGTSCISGDLGVVLYIFDSVYTGGTVSAVVNGQTVSISQPGECMVLANGVSYSVDTVTSGRLQIVELYFVYYPYPVDSLLKPTWSAHRVPGALQHTSDITTDSTLVGGDNTTDSTADSVTAKISSSIDFNLRDYGCVMLCLSTFYSIVHTDCSNRRFETDPDTLTGADASLYALLVPHYNVDVVSLCIYNNELPRATYTACVLDYAQDGSDSTDCIDTTAAAGDIPSNNDRIKLVLPMAAVGNPFLVNVSCGTKHVKGCGRILTSLMVTCKE